MKKISLSLLIITLVISIVCPVFANETIIEDNLAGNEIEEIKYPEKMVNNYGTVKLVNDSGHIENNYGTITNMSGTVDDNYGTIENNKGTVLRNNYSTDNTLTNSISNTENGIVLENYAQVTGGSIEKNYSKDVSNTTINNNYSTEVGENVIIKKNFVELISNATIENQYYKLTVKGNIDFICKIDTNNNLEDNIYTDAEGQTWIRAEDAMFEVKVQRGYRIVGETNVIAAGNTIVSKEDSSNIGFSNVSGEIIIEVETEEIETFKVIFDANGGTFKSNGKELLTYEKWLPEDYDTLEIPTKNGYKFLGYFTEKDGGVSFDSYYNEAGVDQDMTLYAHWEEISKDGALGEMEQQPSNSENAGQPVDQIQTAPAPIVNEKTDNPPTGDNVILWMVALIISVVGLIFTQNKDDKK